MMPMDKTTRRGFLEHGALAGAALALPGALFATRPADGVKITFERSDDKGELTVNIDPHAGFTYQYGNVDIVHYYPVRSPSSKLLTVQQTDPFPHHRSFWFADKVQLAGGPPVGFYDALYSGVKDPEGKNKHPRAPFKNHIRHSGFGPIEQKNNVLTVVSNLVWEMNGDKPVLDERRVLRVVALGAGEYLMDVTYKVTAAHGDVSVVSDDVHYAWPYVRMHPQFSVQDGKGRITNSEGGVNQKGTHNQVATWIDYSGTVDGVTEGLAILSHPGNGHPHRWLTRDYGCFGPRRVNELSGKKFEVKRGESLTQRVGVLVHRGDVEAGKVAARYQQYAEARL